MKINKKIIVCLAAVALIGIGLYFFFYTNTFRSVFKNPPDDWNSKTETPTVTEENFNFIFKYGICNETAGCNELNTLTGVYSKNMCGDPDAKTDIKLSQEEMDIIYKKITELGFLNSDVQSVNDRFFMVEPSENFYLTIKTPTIEKTISWNQVDSDKYRAFDKFLIPLIEFKSEYKKLPTKNCGYM